MCKPNKLYPIGYRTHYERVLEALEHTLCAGLKDKRKRSEHLLDFNYNLSELDKLSDKEKEYALKILEEMSNGSSKSYNALMYADYSEIPVDIITFIEDRKYLGNAWHDASGNSKLYPYWKDILEKLFPTNTDTAVNNTILSGARGIGKSEIAVTIGAYLMYRAMCLKNPVDYFHLKPSEKLCFAFMNITKALAEEIGISKFQNTIQMSPWFMAHGKITQNNHQDYWNPPDYIDVIIGSQNSDVIGKPILFAFFDEISFIRNMNIDEQKRKALDMIDTAIGGMKTRFMHKGKSPALLVLASSKRSEKSFLETHMKKKVESEKDNVLIVDKAVWDVKPPETYSGKRFNVALGNKFLVSQVIPDGEDTTSWSDKGYKILSVPVEFRANFLDEIDRALCDYAGISSSDITKYISGMAVSEIINEGRQNPFVKDIIEVGNGSDDTAQYYDFFDMSRVPKELMNRPLFIHMDMSVSGDMTGIAGVWIKGKKVSTEGVDQANDLFYTLAFSVSIKAPKGRQISFEKNKNFIYWLKQNGFRIKSVSTDSFQSVETGQVLQSKGYDYQQISVDRVDSATRICKPYQYFRSTIYEKRLDMYRSQTLIDEIIDLERNTNTGKIDHPDGGRKDISDATCLHPDTKVFLLSGKSKTIGQLYSERDYLDDWVLGYDTITSKVVPVKILDVKNNGYRDDLVKISLDNGESIICTQDHKILCRDGSYCDAVDSLGKSLMPFSYESRKMYKDRNYPYVYVPNLDMTTSGIYLHKLVSESVHRLEKEEKEKNLTDGDWIVIHHKDCDRNNNRPDNLVYLTNREHSNVHCELNSSETKRKQVSDSVKRRIANGTHPFLTMDRSSIIEKSGKRFSEYNKTEAHKDVVRKTNKRLASIGQHAFQVHKGCAHTPEVCKSREGTCLKKYGAKNPFSSPDIQQKCMNTNLERYGYSNLFNSKEVQHSIQLKKLMRAYTRVCKEFGVSEMSLMDFKIYCNILHTNGSATTEKYIKELGLPIDCSNFDEKEYHRIRNVGNMVRMFLSERDSDLFTFDEFTHYHADRLNSDKKYRLRFLRVKFSYEDILRMGFKMYNHRVVSVEKVGGSEVYDIVLGDVHNFALCSGIFVHNCGAIYNASSHAEEFAFDYGEFLDVIDEQNKTDSYANMKKQISVDFEEALNQIHDPLRLANKNKENGNQTPGFNSPTNASFNEDVYASLGIFVI